MNREIFGSRVTGSIEVRIKPRKYANARRHLAWIYSAALLTLISVNMSAEAVQCRIIRKASPLRSGALLIFSFHLQLAQREKEKKRKGESRTTGNVCILLMIVARRCFIKENYKREYSFQRVIFLRSNVPRSMNYFRSYTTIIQLLYIEWNLRIRYESERINNIVSQI